MTGIPIRRVVARQIFDSRGRPTVEAEVLLESGHVGRGVAPSGASTGRHEAWELRDRDPAHFEGLGVSRAVEHVCHEIHRALIGLDAADQARIDETLREIDGTHNLARLGANAVLPVSLAVCRAAALACGTELYRHIQSLFAGRAPSMPMPMVNILSGGAHAGRGMDVQDFLAVPVGAGDYSEAVSWILRVRASATALMQAQGLSTLLADEGGLSPGYASAEQALDLMVQAIERAGLLAGKDIAIALDVAASELYANGAYTLAKAGRSLDGAAMADYIAKLVTQYPIVSVEDALDQDDWTHWRRFTAAADHIQIVGDDLFVTHPNRIREGAAQKVANAALIKINQNGTLTGTLEAMTTAWSAGYETVVSARSGETEDTFIADLAVGTGGGQIKIGSVRTSERMAKYNQLLRIAEASALPLDNPFKRLVS